jgi:uncharacterized membrane protein
LVAIHPTMIWLDVLGLTYSLSIFLGVLASFILLSYFSENTKRKHLLVFLYFICATLCLLSHYFTIFILMAHGLIVLFKFGFNRIALFYYTAISAALVTFYVGWFMKYGTAGNMIMQIQNGYWLMYANGFGIGENQWLPPTTLKYFTISYIQSIILYLGNNYQNIVSLKFSILISLPIIAAILINVRRKDLSKKKFISIAFISLMPIFASMVSSITSGHLISSEVKYLSFSIPFFCIFLGYCFTPSLGQRIISFMLVLCVTPTLVYDIFLNNIKEDDSSVKFVSIDKLSENNFNPKSDTLIFNNWHDAACSDIMFPSKPLILQRVSESDIDVYKISHPR